MKGSDVYNGMFCHRCSQTRTLNAPSVGNLKNPLIAFVSGMPSADQIYNPKVPYGRSGEILRQIMAPLDFDITRVMYTYACLCHSDRKNSPRAKNIRACSMRLLRELKAANPKIVVPLGRFGFAAMNGQGTMKKSRGGHQVAGKFNLIPTINPEGLYANPDGAVDLVRDLKFIVDVAMDRQVPVTYPPVENYRFIETHEQLQEFYRAMRKAKPKKGAIDLETTGLDSKKDKILSISISIKEGEADIIDWVRLIENNPVKKRQLDKFLQYIGCIYHHGMFDHLFLQAKGMHPNFTDDTMLSSYALDERQGAHGLKRIIQDRFHLINYDDELAKIVGSRRIFDVKRSIPPFNMLDWSDDVSRRAIADYNGADSDYTLRIHNQMKVEMKEDHVDHIPRDILVPASKHFIRFKQDGLLIDREYHDSLGRKWEKEIHGLEAKIKDTLKGRRVNLDSVPQVKKFIFKDLGLSPMSMDFNKTLDQDEILEEISLIDDPEAQEYWHTASSAVFGNMKADSTSMFMLYWLGAQHPFPKYLVKYRLAQKRYGTYYEGYRKRIDETNHIRPSVKLHGARTGRLSSEDPNIHGMPRSDTLHNIKRAVIAEPGFTIIAPDYSQAEIRMMAHFAKDEVLIQTLYGVDIHRAISLALFGMSEEEMSAYPKEEQKLYRRAAKTIAFGLIYGRGAKSLATQMNISQAETEKFISKYFKMMPQVRAWINKQHSIVIRDGEVVSLYGRKRRFPFIPNKKIASKAKRQAVNHPVQSSVSDMTLLANMRIIDTLDDREIDNRVGPHIHDGFWFQVPDEAADEAIEITREHMTDVGFETDVPFVADIEVGKTWGDLHTI